MKKLPLLLSIALAACSSGPPATAPAPAVPGAPPKVTSLEAPLDWHLRDLSADGIAGISLLKAERDLLAGKQPKRTVVVAVLDVGVDTAHLDLHSQLWTNPREVPGNGLDDDGNGFADDVRGWNFLGGKDGRDVEFDTMELTRLAGQCQRARDSVPDPYRARCPELQSQLARKQAETEGVLNQIGQIESVYAQVLPVLRNALGADSVTVARVTALVPASDRVRQAKQVYLQLSGNLSPEDVAEAKGEYEAQARYGYNISYNPRTIVGDSYPDTAVRQYGNPDVSAGDPMHGTHVAGIIGALDNNVGSRGIAKAVRIMAVRTLVSGGDERDKDVANAIRYAADNGAQVLNMSFGKYFSPYKPLVDAAVKYAEGKGVLMVVGAGNEGYNLDTTSSFPNPKYLSGGRAQTWISVGATSWKGADSLVAGFSNYGKTMVDVFAPGVDIYSTVPHNGWKRLSGTSMASPVVAGVAALIMSYYPNLTASDVKRIIVESSAKLPDVVVARPGGSGSMATARFSELSISGGIVNAYNALRMAEQFSAARP